MRYRSGPTRKHGRAALTLLLREVPVARTLTTLAVILALTGCQTFGAAAAGGGSASGAGGGGIIGGTFKY